MKTRSVTYFTLFANSTSRLAGRPMAFILALAIVLVWAATGPIFGFSDTWQLATNTGTTIVTFLMVFVIQNTQNRDTQALQLKLDELIRTTQGAHNSLLDLESLDSQDLDRIRQLYENLAEKARSALRRDVKTGVMEMDPNRPVADSSAARMK